MYELVGWPGVVYATGTLPEMWELAEGCGDVHIYCGSRRVVRNAGSVTGRYLHLERTRRS